MFFVWFDLFLNTYKKLWFSRDKTPIIAQVGTRNPIQCNVSYAPHSSTVKFGDKERFDKEQIGAKEPFPVTNCQFTSFGIFKERS